MIVHVTTGLQFLTVWTQVLILFKASQEQATEIISNPKLLVFDLFVSLHATKTVFVSGSLLTLNQIKGKSSESVCTY